MTTSLTGSVIAVIRIAWRVTASSNTLRTKRPLPKASGRGSGTSRRNAPSTPSSSAKPALLGVQPEDAPQLVGGVVGEGDRAREPGRDAGVGLDEALHLPRVAGHDHHDLVAVVLHQLEQGRDRLVAEVAERVGRDQGVGLVDEQHAAGGLVEAGGGARCGLADVLADQVGPAHLDQVAVREHAELGVDPGQQPGHRGLRGAGVAGEDHVPRLLRRRHAGLGAQLLRLELGDQPLDLLLDRRQADQLLELGHRVADLDLGHGEVRHLVAALGRREPDAVGGRHRAGGGRPGQVPAVLQQLLWPSG